MKYLCVCDGGNVRSVAMAFWLKYLAKQEAIAVGRLQVSQDTMNMLSSWADKIVLMESHMIESISENFHDKVVVCDVGPDRWGVFVHPELWMQIVTLGASLQVELPPKEFVFGETS